MLQALPRLGPTGWNAEAVAVACLTHIDCTVSAQVSQRSVEIIIVVERVQAKDSSLTRVEDDEANFRIFSSVADPQVLQ